MIRSSATLGLAALLLSLNFASAQTFSPGEQCRPAGADLSQVRDCRVHAVGTRLTCRCVVMPGVNEAARMSDAKEVAAQADTPTVVH